MDVLNFISWIKNGQQVTTVDPTQTLIPLGLRDPRRDDGYRSGTITAQDFINSVTPPSIISVGPACYSTLRTGVNSNMCSQACYSILLGAQSNISGGAQYAAVSGGFLNNAQGFASVISGGVGNSANSSCSVISGGASNTIYGLDSNISGGYGHQIYGSHSTVSGGCSNSIYNDNSIIGSGRYNLVTGSCSGILSGFSNSISVYSSAIVSGIYNVIDGNRSFIGSGNNNYICNGAVISGILGGQCNMAACSQSFIVGSNITSNRECATFVNNLSIVNIPTSPAGLPSKSVWSNAGILTIVP